MSENLLEVKIEVSQQNSLNFKIQYPTLNQATLPQRMTPDPNQKIKQITQEDQKSYYQSEYITMLKTQNTLQQSVINLQFQLQNALASFSSANLQLQTLKKLYTKSQIQLAQFKQTSSKQKQALLSKIITLQQNKEQLINQKLNLQSEISVQSEKRKKIKNQYKRLLQAYKQRQKNKSTAETLLQQLQKSNKNLIQSKVNYQKKVSELQKRVFQLQKQNSKLKFSRQKQDSNLAKRQLQINRIINKVKVLQDQNSKFKQNLRKKDQIINNLKKSIQQEKLQIPRQKQISKDKQLTEAYRKIASKQSQIRVMREMIKSWQTQFKQKDLELSRSKRTRLPPVGKSTRSSKSNIPMIEKKKKYRLQSYQSPQSLISGSSKALISHTEQEKHSFTMIEKKSIDRYQFQEQVVYLKESPQQQVQQLSPEVQNQVVEEVQSVKLPTSPVKGQNENNTNQQRHSNTFEDLSLNTPVIKKEVSDQDYYDENFEDSSIDSF